jgi:hypothetical protein
MSNIRIGDCTCCGKKNKKVKVIEARKLCEECIIKIREKVLSYLFTETKIKRRPLKGE